MHISFKGPVVRVWGHMPATTTGVLNINDLVSLITYAALGAAAKLQVSSSSAADDGDPAGTGAQTLKIFGMDADYNLLEETITLNGQTQVETAGTFLRVFAATVMMAGSGYSNAGNIFIIKTGTGGTLSGGVPPTLTSAWIKIPIGAGQGTSGIFTVPLGKKFQYRTILASGYAQPSAITVWEHTPLDTSHNALRQILAFNVSTGMYQFTPPKFLDPTAKYPIKFSEKTDIYLRCQGASANGVVDATLVLEEYFSKVDDE